MRVGLHRDRFVGVVCAEVLVHLSLKTYCDLVTFFGASFSKKEPLERPTD